MAAVLKKNKSQSLAWTRAFALGILTVALILSLGSYYSTDPSFSTFSSAWKHPNNVLGYVGSWTADSLFQLFGYGAWGIPLLLFTSILRWMIRSDRKHYAVLGARWYAALVILLTSFGLAADLSFAEITPRDFPPQGLLGIAASTLLKPIFGQVGSYLLVAALTWCFCMVWWEELPMQIMRAIGFVVKKTVPLITSTINGLFSISKTILINSLGFFKALNLKSLLKPWNKNKTKISSLTGAKNNAESDSTNEPSLDFNSMGALSVESNENNFSTENPGQTHMRSPVMATLGRMPLIRALRGNSNENKEFAPKTKPKERSRESHEWDLPPMSLLQYAKKKTKGQSEGELREIARKITGALKSFEIEGEVVEILPGPIITMYEFQPAPGVRVQKIISAATDLAMSLGAPSVRIVAPIPGKSVAGIEVPNPDREEIVLRDVYENTRERASKMRLPLILGKDSEGRPVCEDLARMPHLLVGGATSMGKSVLVNSILTGLLCRYTPSELRIIIVDPKLVEFKVFEDIPHLLLPIVNDANDASQALKWAVSETKRRYVVMQKHSAKNIEAYNKKAEELESSETERPEKLSSIVIIIDELAELMLTAKKDVENSIVRLTQLARAAGIHLIMATQRPSADVVTGLIKSNCPSRAALRVAASTDSRIILDCTGAEQLLGKGDMFFTNTGPMGLRRMQSCFVSDEEIEKVCEFWRSQGEPEYREEILAPEAEESSAMDASQLDSLYGEILEFAKEKGKISTSLIQRRFQIGYSRAARIMEQLEQNGVVGEQQSAGKPRDVIL